jgi:hypothetical protein
MVHLTQVLKHRGECPLLKSYWVRERGFGSVEAEGSQPSDAQRVGVIAAVHTCWSPKRLSIQTA